MGYNLYGGILLHAGDDLNAEKYLEQANAIEENATTFLSVSMVHLKRKNYEKVLNLYEKSLDLSAVALIAREQALAVANVAVQLKRWDLASRILDGQKYVDKEVVHDERYKVLVHQVDDCNKANLFRKNG